MSVHVSSWAWKQTVGDAGAKLVLLKLADQANDLGESFPFQKTLARDCEMSLSTVKRKLKKLHKLDLIETRLGDGRSSLTYVLGPGRGVGQSDLPLAQSDPGGVGQSDPGGRSTVTYKGTVTEPGPSSEDEGRSPRQDAFTAVDRALRFEVYGDADVQLTRPEARKVALAATAIFQAGATPADVSARCAAYRTHKTYAGVALTAPSIAQHWSELAPPAKKLAAMKPCEECGIGGGDHLSDCSRRAAA